MDPVDLLELYGIESADRADCLGLLRRSARPETDAVLARLREQLGSFPNGPPTWEADPTAAIDAYLRFAPEIVEWYRSRGIDADVVEATLADVGRRLALHRRLHGTFGIERWSWITWHLSGGLYQLGRLQQGLHRQVHLLGDVMPGEVVISLHVPAIGPMSSEDVTASLARGPGFFRRHFGEFPVPRYATCTSWLLDPYLIEHLPPTSNIASFARRFITPDDPMDAPAEALYFVFGTRDLSTVERLPRETSLQRLVLDRIAAGDTWRLATGYLRLW
jgi:GNAT-like C-terminal domain/N-acyltransferase N-terminal domain